MRLVWQLLIFIITYVTTQAQSFFSITPDFGGDGMAGMAFNVIPLEEDIKVIGLVPDSIVPGFDGGSWPILGTLSYGGEYVRTDYLIDSNYSDPFRYFTRGIAFKDDSVCYLYDRRDIGNALLDAYLVELNYRHGKVMRSIIVDNDVTNSESFSARAVAVANNGDIVLVNIDTDIDTFPQFITVLNSSFQEKTQSIVQNFGRKNVPVHIEVDDLGSISIVGMSQGKPSSVWWESKLYKQVLDSNRMTTSFSLAPTEFDQSIILADHYPVIKTLSENWVIASQRVLETSDCPNCSIGIPYVVCISKDFTEVLWETRVFDGDESSSSPLYWVSSVTEVDDGYIFAGAKQGGVGNTSGILGKVGLNGDSLWLKHYVPVGWDSTRALWFDLKDIKTTPHGNIVACGRSFDRYNNIRVPWILHLDPDGCLEPGCNPVSTLSETGSFAANLQIFPNPASTDCAIRVLVPESYTDYQLRIFDAKGILIKRLEIGGKDVNFLLDLSQWPTGSYFVQLTDPIGRQITKELLIL